MTLKLKLLDLATVNPQPMLGPKRWVPVPQVRVDVKSYGMTKHQPAVVIATCRDELLLKLLVEPQSEWWSVQPGGLVRVGMDQTRQGHRFTRTITKVVKLLGRLGREAGRARATAQQIAARAAARVGRDGECQVCANRQIVQKGLLVLHGYERPGDGAVAGECYGRGYPPYEVSCERLRWFIDVVLIGDLGRVRAQLVELPSLPELNRQVLIGVEHGWPKYRVDVVARGAVGFDKLEEQRRRELEGRMRALEFEIQQQGRRLSAWRPAA